MSERTSLQFEIPLRQAGRMGIAAGLREDVTVTVEGDVGDHYKVGNRDKFVRRGRVLLNVSGTESAVNEVINAAASSNHGRRPQRTKKIS